MGISTKFKGYCVAEIMGVKETMPPVKLNSVEQCVNYVMLHKPTFKEVIIEDEEEYTILHAVDGVVVFPEQFKGY
jgi:hypothetical protein